MDTYGLIHDIANVLNDLYNFLVNVLTYEVNLFGATFQVIELVGYLAVAGLAIYVVAVIVSALS